MVEELGIPSKKDTMVLDISRDRVITAVNREDGVLSIQAKAVVLAMGCRERPRGALNIPGTRPAGVYTAGTAQRLVNMEGVLPGRRVVILGSGDIGLIMARRMTLEGAKVLCVAELMPYSGGLKRNIVQCLEDFNIPLKLSHTVVKIEGKKRVEGITIAEVENGRPVPGTEEHYDCDTLLLSCGLLPENELSRGAQIEMSSVTNGPCVDESLQTSVPGIFAAGNVLHVHDLVDYVSEEAGLAGREAAAYIRETKKSGQKSSGTLEGTDCGQKEVPQAAVRVLCENGIRYCVPEIIHPGKIGNRITMRMRAGNVYRNKILSMYVNQERIYSRKRPVVTPGEMETIVLTGAAAAKLQEAEEIRLSLEDA
jgi:thioredoxin reductase